MSQVIYDDKADKSPSSNFLGGRLFSIMTGPHSFKWWLSFFFEARVLLSRLVIHFTKHPRSDASVRETQSVLFPPIMLHSLAGFLLTATSLIHHALGATVSLDDSGTFQAQRPCAQRCYSGGVGDSFRVLQEIGCESLPGSNDCYCRADLQDQAQAYISSCVWSACASKTQDLNIATQLYIDYCTSNGFLRDAGVTTAAPVTTGTLRPQATVTVTVVSTLVVSSGGEKRVRLLGF